MKFFEQQDTRLTFKRFSADKDKEGHRILNMRFFLLLQPELAKHLPAFLKRAYESLRTPENFTDEIGFDHAIEKQNVTFYDLPGHRGDSIRFPAVDLEDVDLEREVKYGTVFIRLLFTITVGADKASGPWAIDRFTNDLWATFGQAQAEMFEGTPKDKKRAKKVKNAKRGDGYLQ